VPAGNPDGSAVTPADFLGMTYEQQQQHHQQQMQYQYYQQQQQQQPQQWWASNHSLLLFCCMQESNRFVFVWQVPAILFPAADGVWLPAATAAAAAAPGHGWRRVSAGGWLLLFLFGVLGN
jgi:hypothetical protein